MATGRIYSVGYEGWKLRSLVQNLSQNRVGLLIDVRLNPVSRRPGFSKRQLSQALESAGIEYRHEPLLGNPADNRDAFRSTATIERGRRRMKKRLENGSRVALEELVASAQNARIAVLCVERATDACHRAVILQAACELDPELTILPVL
jgi:uncharacterized protein (DUF488 family)